MDNPLRSVRSAEFRSDTPKVGGFWAASTVRDSVRGPGLSEGKGTFKRRLESSSLADGTGSGSKLAKIAPEKPDKFVRCPITKEKLDFAKLTKIKFTRIDESSKGKCLKKEKKMGVDEGHKDSTFCCAISGDPLTNATKLLALRTTGDVISFEAYEQAVKNTMVCPFTNKKLIASDIINIRRGGTGFSSVNDLARTEKGPAFNPS